MLNRQIELQMAQKNLQNQRITQQKRNHIQQPRFTLYLHNTPACQRIKHQLSKIKLKQNIVGIQNFSNNKFPQHVKGVPTICDQYSRQIFPGKAAFKILDLIYKKFKDTSFFSLEQNEDDNIILVPHMKPSDIYTGPITAEYIDGIIRERDRLLNTKQISKISRD